MAAGNTVNEQNNAATQNRDPPGCDGVELMAPKLESSFWTTVEIHSLALVISVFQCLLHLESYLLSLPCIIPIMSLMNMSKCILICYVYLHL